MQGRAGCGRTARDCAHIPRVQWVAASAASLPSTRHAALASRLSGRCSCPSAQLLRGQLSRHEDFLEGIQEEVKNDGYLGQIFHEEVKNWYFLFLGEQLIGRGVASCREHAHQAHLRADVFRHPRAGRALQQVLLSDTVACAQRIVI